MKWIRLGVFGAVAAAAGCNLPFSPGRAVTLPISRIQAPVEVPTGVPFTVIFVVQTGGCRSFTRLATARTANTVTAVAHGRDSSGPKVSCPNDIREEPQSYTVQPPFSGPFMIVAKQPTGAETTVEVRVR